MKHYALVVGCACLLVPSLAFADDKEQCIAATSAAQDARAQGKLMSAREQLIACARDACPTVIRHDCAQWLGEVEASLPTVVLSARDASGHDVIDVKVSVDGQARATSLDGKAMVIDPGAHTLSFVREGAPPFEQKVVIREGEKNRAINVELPGAAAAGTATASTATTQAPTDGGQAPPPGPDTTPHGKSALPVVGLVIAGVGVVGVGLGAVFGGVAASKWSDAQTQCPASRGCAPGSTAYALRDDASSMATISTIAFVAGGVALAGGLTLFLVAPKHSGGVSAAVAPTPGGVLFSGRF